MLTSRLRQISERPHLRPVRQRHRPADERHSIHTARQPPHALVRREEWFVAGMQVWLLDKSRPLGDILVEQEVLDPDERRLLDPLVQKQLAKHGGDPIQSLAAISSRPSAKKELAELRDPEIQRSLDGAREFRRDQPPPTGGLPTIARADDGLRFHILRPHAKGGLGVVYLAHYREIDREVATGRG
jgi:hypothetical protein